MRASMTLRPCDEPFEIKENAVLAVAVKLGETRLIDNILVAVKKER